VKEGVLLIRPVLYEDEAPNGIFLRAAYENGWESATEMLKAYRIEFRRSIFVNVTYLQYALDILGITADAKLFAFQASRSRGYVHLGNEFTLPFRILRSDVAPICPACLAERDYLRRSWCIRLVCACSVHRCALVFNCPECSELLTTDRQGPSICRCGFDLRVAPTTSAPEGCHSMLRTINLRHKRKALDVCELFFCLEEADLTRNNSDIEWCDTAVALYANEERSVQALVDIVRRSSGREHPRMTLARLLMLNEKVKARTMDALSRVRVSGAPDPPKEQREGTVSWDVAKVALGVRSDGDLKEIRRLCLQSADSRESRHVFTRASVNRLLWRLTGPSALPGQRAGIEIHGSRKAASTVTIVRAIMADSGLVSQFDMAFGISTLRLIDNCP
jgi:hypothetical protein